MTNAGHPTTVDEVFDGPMGYGLMCGENHTSLYELENGVCVINEEHYREDVDSRTLGFEVIGTEGALAVDRAEEEMLFHSRNPFLNPATVRWEPVPLSAEERTLAGFDYSDPRVGNTADLWMVDEWVRALDEGRDLVVNAEVGAATMEMIHGAYASHAEGRRVTLPLVDRGHPLERWLEREGRPLPERRPAAERYDTWAPWALARSRGGVLQAA
jgi:predicted dehydrogenase